MTVHLIIHLEAVDGAATWWADTDDVPGFYAAADTLEELRERVIAALAEVAPGADRIIERLASAEHGVRTLDVQAA
jgi:predicted RNase H-like HicB family nuclease